MTKDTVFIAINMREIPYEYEKNSDIFQQSQVKVSRVIGGSLIAYGTYIYASYKLAACSDNQDVMTVFMSSSSM